MNRKTIVLAALPPVVLAIAGALYFTLAPAFEKPPVAPVAAAAVPVVAGIVSSHDVPLYLRGVGTVIAYNTDVVRSQIQGQLTRITFTEGQTVKAGDLLAQIDPRPYQAQLDQMTATRDRDQAQLANAHRQSRPLHASWRTRAVQRRSCPTRRRRRSPSCRTRSKPTRR